jgi:hypothetical protein
MPFPIAVDKKRLQLKKKQRKAGRAKLIPERKREVTNERKTC